MTLSMIYFCIYNWNCLEKNAQQLCTCKEQHFQAACICSVLLSVSEEVRQRGSSGTGLWNSWEYEKGNQHSLWDGGVPMRQLPWGLMASFNIIINFPDPVPLKNTQKMHVQSDKGFNDSLTFSCICLVHWIARVSCLLIAMLCVCAREKIRSADR